MKKIEVYNYHDGALVDEWDYEKTRKRFSKVIQEISPRKANFNDQDLIDYLSFINSYCMFSIVE